MPLAPTLPLVLLVAAVGLCAYTYLGYPAILELLRVVRRAPPHRPQRLAAEWPAISVALPVYNEVEGIASTLERILAIEYPAERRQILVVSDASTDGTDEIVTRFAPRGVELVRLPQRRGKTAAENAARSRLTGEIIVNTDASVRIDAGAVKHLVAAFDEKFTSTAIANRDRAQGTAYEYETIWTEGRPGQPARSRLLIQSGSADIVQVGGSSQQQRFKLTARTRTRLRLSTFYFPGWRVFVDDHERPIEYWNPSGLIEFVVERGEHVVEARFEPTPEGWLGRALAGLGLLALVLTFAWGASWPAVGAIWIRGATRIPPPLPPQGRKALPPAPLPLRERGGG